MMPLIATKFQYVNSPFLFFFPLTTCFGPYRPSSGENIQLMLYKDYFYYHGSAVHTELDVCLRYFDPWSPIHVIRHSIYDIKTASFLLPAGFWFGVFLNPQGGCDMSLQNVRWFSKDYVVLCLRRRNSS
jgi:hypothetical protein